MKNILRLMPFFLIISLVAACGYHNPYIYNGPHKNIYITEWKNQTSELDIDSKIYRSLIKWFQRTGSISTVKQKEGADIIIAGEIISIDLPSLSYGLGRNTSEVKVVLRVRYIVKEVDTNRILLEVPEQMWWESYLVSSNSSTNMDNETKALETIIEDLSKKIYQKTIATLPKL